MAVAPQDFLGEVVCADAPRSATHGGHVLRPRHRRGAGGSFALPSTVLSDGGAYRPLSCLQPAATGFVIPGHRYDAEVDVYDRTDVHALGPGGRTLVRDSTGEYVPPLEHELWQEPRRLPGGRSGHRRLLPDPLRARLRQARRR
ncbi:MAG: hypothetical protein H6717_09460 [Polyangiaceae bacterium]|nr:hypothetical protein [Polyangiaceae bacterium]